MKNKDLVKKLAIALGIVGSVNMLTPAMSAMEEINDEFDEIVSLDYQISKTLEVANNLSRDDYLDNTKALFIASGDFDYQPIKIITDYVMNLVKLLKKDKEQLTDAQITDIKNIVLKMGRFAIKDGYKMIEGRLQPQISVGFSYTNLAQCLKELVQHGLSKDKLKDDLSSTFDDMMEDAGSEKFHWNSPPQNETYLDKYYDIFQILEDSISKN